MREKIRKILYETDWGWTNEIQPTSEEVYQFLEDNYEVFSQTWEFNGGLEPMRYVMIYDKLFTQKSKMLDSGKKEVLNWIAWNIEDEFELMDRGVLRRTIRKFLNDKLKEHGF